MFNCSKCEVYQAEVNHLREMQKQLMDRLIALSNPSAYAAVQYSAPSNPNDFYGNGDDDEVSYDALTGARINIRKKAE